MKKALKFSGRFIILLMLTVIIDISPVAAKSKDSKATVGVLPLLISRNTEGDVLNQFERHYFAKKLIEKLSVTQRVSGAFLVHGLGSVDIVIRGEILESTSGFLLLEFSLLAPDGSDILGGDKLTYDFKIKKRQVKKQVKKQKDPFADAWRGVAKKTSNVIRKLSGKTRLKYDRAIYGIQVGESDEATIKEQATEKALLLSQETRLIEQEQLLSPQTTLFLAKANSGESTYWAWRMEASKLFKKQRNQERAPKNYTGKSAEIYNDIADVRTVYSRELNSAIEALNDTVEKLESDFNKKSVKIRSNIILRLECDKGMGASCAKASVVASKAGDLALGAKLSTLGCKAGNGRSCYLLAKISERQGKTEQAKKAANAGCKFEYGKACETGARLAIESKQFEVAEQYATRGCETGFAPSCLQLGEIASTSGNQTSATQAFKRACTLKIPAACALLAKVAEADNNYKQQVSAGTAGCNLDHGESCELASLGEARLNRISRAQKLAERGCELNWPAACNVLAKIENHWRRFDKALFAAEKACDQKIEEACVMARKIRLDNN